LTSGGSIVVVVGAGSMAVGVQCERRQLTAAFNSVADMAVTGWPPDALGL
jgi:hypothetical protein